MTQDHPATRSRFSQRRDINDVGAVVEGLWPDLPQVDTKTLLGRIFCIEEYRSINNQKYSGPYFIMRCTDAEGVFFTTATGGQVIARKLQEISEKAKFPIVAVMWQSKPASAGVSGYYDLHSMDQEPEATDFVLSEA